jgi:alpha-ketoglutarate-dependent taurine dioxygenase
MLVDESKRYAAWRAAKLAAYPTSIDEIRVPVASLAAPTADEQRAIVDACRRCGMALYQTASDGDGAAARHALRHFAATFGLGALEDHRSAGSDGIVAIEVTEADGKKGFIPYTNKPLNWHTDGYYNAPGDEIRAMILHCVHPAASGGENALLDPEIVYIRLRDRDPRLLQALMHPEAMTIPESVEEDGRVRPTSTGPVFVADPADGSISMRYTARLRNVIWRDDPDTRDAVALLSRLLSGEEEPLILRHKLAAGEGLISNNILHTRTAFDNGAGAARLLLRGRYRKRIAGT